MVLLPNLVRKEHKSRETLQNADDIGEAANHITNMVQQAARKSTPKLTSKEETNVNYFLVLWNVIKRLKRPYLPVLVLVNNARRWVRNNPEKVDMFAAYLENHIATAR